MTEVDSVLRMRTLPRVTQSDRGFSWDPGQESLVSQLVVFSLFHVDEFCFTRWTPKFLVIGDCTVLFLVPSIAFNTKHSNVFGLGE